MQFPSLSELIPILQTAIGPVILISGVGLLLLTMTNRLGQTVSRIRQLNDGILKSDEAGMKRIGSQISILWRRAKLIRMAILLASASALVVSVLVIALFFMALWHIEIAWVIVLLFMISLGCPIGSLVVFIYDVNQSLVALKLELQDNEKIKGVKRKKRKPV